MPIENLLNTIATLTNIKVQREELGLRQKKQAREGFETAVDTLSKLDSARQREEYVAGLRGSMPDTEVDRLSNMLSGINDTVEAQRRAAIATGVSSMSTSEKTNMGREAATVATTGQTRGAVGASSLLAAMTQDANDRGLDAVLGKERAGEVRAAGVTKILTGTSPGEVAVDASLATTPGLAGSAAKIKAGTQMTEAQGANLELGWGQLNATIKQIAQQGALGTAEIQSRQNIALADLRSKSGITPSQQVELIKQAGDILEILNTKSMNDAGRQYYAALFNKIAPSINVPPIQAGEDIPSAVKGFKSLFGGGTGNVPMGGATTPTAPTGPTINNPGGPY